MPRTAIELLEIDLLRTLATKIRFLSCAQAASGWCCDQGEALATLTDILSSLHTRGFLTRDTIEIRTVQSVTKPIFSWTAGDDDPTLETWQALAETLATRWSEQLVPMEVYFAARPTANLFGVPEVGIGRPCEWSHDYHITEVYLHYRQTFPQQASRWQGEAARPKWGSRIPRMKDPDAFLLDSNGTIERVVEVAGKYSAAHLDDLHRHCAGEGFERVEAWRAQSATDYIRNPYDQIEIGYELW